MKQSPHDQLGVLPHDHEEIENSDILIRYVPAVHINRESGEPKISSAAFSPSTPPDDPRSSVSVDVEKLLVAAGRLAPYRTKNGESFARISVEKVRLFKFLVGWDPEPDNPAHGGIWGVGKSKSNQRKLSRECAVLVVVPLDQK
jgi:hypothetical protein